MTREKLTPTQSLKYRMKSLYLDLNLEFKTSITKQMDMEESRLYQDKTYIETPDMEMLVEKYMGLILIRFDIEDILQDWFIHREYIKLMIWLELEGTDYKDYIKQYSF